MKITSLEMLLTLILEVFEGLINWCGIWIEVEVTWDGFQYFDFNHLIMFIHIDIIDINAIINESQSNVCITIDDVTVSHLLISL